MTKVENVQRKYTKHVKGLSKFSYEERFHKLKLPSLEYRILRGDMIQVFKIANNYYDHVTTKNLFQFQENPRLRGHNFKIIKQSVNNFCGKNIVIVQYIYKNIINNVYIYI